MDNLNRVLGEKNATPQAPRLALVVDDEVSICDALCQILQDESFQTLRAHDGPEALEIVREFKPSVVFLDIWLPGWDGIETLEKIRAVSPNSEVIMISGHASISNALEATKRGAFDFIEKPLDLEAIILSAHRALERVEQRIFGKLKEPALGNGGLNSAGDATSTRLAPTLLPHAGILSKGLAGNNIGQRTLRSSTILYGHCLHSGRKSGLVLEPLPANSGIHFSGMGSAASVPAFVQYVESTAFATTIRSGQTAAATIEHLMSALHAYKISNLLIKCNGEVPIFDGSALEFCNIIEEVGVLEQEGAWHEIVIDKKYEVSAGNNGEVITIEPSDAFRVHYELDYPAPVGRQSFEFALTSSESFKNEIAGARTFGFMKDIEKLQKAGLAAGGRLDNFILIGSEGVINTQLRFDNELVRHKILDAIGDLYLIGRPLRGKVTARMTGHSDNINLLRAFAPACQ